MKQRLAPQSANLWVILFAFQCLIMLVLDLVWITFVAGPTYQFYFAHLLDLKLMPALGFYLLFGVGLFYFSLVKNVGQSLNRCIVDAAFFGANVYGGYALTLLAVFSFWRLDLAMLEIFWGALMSSIVVLATFWVGIICSKIS